MVREKLILARVKLHKSDVINIQIYLMVMYLIKEMHMDKITGSAFNFEFRNTVPSKLLPVM